MCRQMWTFVRKVTPVEIRLVVVGVVFGLATGAFRLGQSVDEATAIGIATCFAMTVGAWLGLNLYFLVSRGYTAWLATIRKRIEAVEARMAPVMEPVGGDYGKQARGSAMARLTAYSFYVSPLCFVALAYSVIMTALRVQIDYPGATVSFYIALVSLSVLILIHVAQCLYFLRLNMMIASIERRLNRVQSVSPAARRADVLYGNINRTDRIVHQIGGVGKSIAERTTA